MNIIKTSLLTAFILMTGSFAFAIDTSRTYTSQQACENANKYDGETLTCVYTNVDGWRPCNTEAWEDGLYSSDQKQTCCCSTTTLPMQSQLCGSISCPQ